MAVKTEGTSGKYTQKTAEQNKKKAPSTPAKPAPAPAKVTPPVTFPQFPPAAPKPSGAPVGPSGHSNEMPDWLKNSLNISPSPAPKPTPTPTNFSTLASGSSLANKFAPAPSAAPIAKAPTPQGQVGPSGHMNEPPSWLSTALAPKPNPTNMVQNGLALATKFAPEPEYTPIPKKTKPNPAGPSDINNLVKMVTGGAVNPTGTVKDQAKKVAAKRPAPKPTSQPSASLAGENYSMPSTLFKDSMAGPQGLSPSLQNHINMTTGGMVNPAPTVEQAAQNVVADRNQPTAALALKAPFGMIPPAIEQQISQQVTNPMTMLGGEAIPVSNDRARWEAPAPQEPSALAPSMYQATSTAVPRTATTMQAAPSSAPTATMDAPIQPGGTTAQPVPSTDGGTGGADGMSAELWNQIAKMLSGDYSDLDRIAQEQGAEAAQAKRDEINAYIEMLRGQQNVDLKRLEDSLSQSRRALEDQSFQQYLQLRQEMANRGLAGSGLHEGRDTQLLLGNNRALAGLMEDYNTNMFDMNQGYSQQLGAAFKDLSNVDQTKMTSDIYSGLYKDAQENAFKKAELFAKMWGQLLPYENQTRDNAANNMTDIFKWINPSGNNTQNNALEQWKWLTQSANNAADNTRAMQVAQLNNQTQLSLGYARINATIQANQVRAQQNAQSLALRGAGQQASQIKSLYDGKINEAKMILSRINAQGNTPELESAYKSVMNQANSYFAELDGMANGNY